MSTTLDESTARLDICSVGRSLFDRGYVHATAGNISVRLVDGFLITPTDACLGFLDPDRLVRLDAGGHQVAGDRASKTITLHRRIYAATAASGCPAGSVIHTHSTSLVACSLKAFEANGSLDEEAELLPPITPYFVMKVGRVPHIPYRRPGADEAAEAVAQAIVRHAAHGRNALASARSAARTPSAAMPHPDTSHHVETQDPPQTRSHALSAAVTVSSTLDQDIGERPDTLALPRFPTLTPDLRRPDARAMAELEAASRLRKAS